MDYIKEKNNNGITLIALIMTVIITLILAGVTISIFTDYDSIDKAEKMQEDTAKVINAQKEFENLVLQDMPKGEGE